MSMHQRHQYKSVWDNLAQNEQQAIAHVIGDVDEAAIQEAGQQTVYWLDKTVGVRPDDVILEIGCGVGRVGAALAPRCREWIGGDVSSNMLDHARARLSAFSNVHFVELSGFDLRSIADASVDLVYCTVVFMHLDEWDRYNYVLEAARVLRPGGRIFVDNFNIASASGWDIFETHWRFPPHQRPPHFSKSSTTDELRAYLEHAGFEHVVSEPNGAWVQAYGTKSEHVIHQGGLIHPPAPPTASEIYIAKLEQELDSLHNVVAQKNAHMKWLEVQLERIAHGRVMRLLNRVQQH